MRKRSRRRPAAREVAFALVIALLASFSIACTGGDTPEVQKPVSETKLRYEQFLAQVGVFGDMGMLGAPWIVAPESDSEVEGDFTIHGWSARPSDIAWAEGANEAYVRVFVVPATVYEATGEFAGYEVTSATRIAPVNPETGDWSLDANSLSDTYQGECVVVAVTHLGGVDGPESPPTSVWFSSADGSSKGSGEAWPAPEVTVYLATAMVQPKGETFKPGAEEQLRGLVEEVQRYYRDASRGRVRVVLIDEIGLLPLDKTDAEIDKALEPWKDAGDTDNAYLSHVLDAVSRIPAEDRPSAGAVFALVAAQPGPDARNSGGRSTHSISWYPWVNGDRASAWRGSFINLPLDQGSDQDMVGVVAHEIAHGLGSFPDSGKPSLPDLYENGKDGYTPADFNNFDVASAFSLMNVGNYFLMANNRAVNPCAYSQEWLGWLAYDNIPLDDLDVAPAFARVPYLDGLLAPVSEVPRVVWTEEDGRQSFTVIEGRTNERESWDAKLPASGLVVYKVRSALKGERQEGQEGWPRSLNWCALLGSSADKYYDFSEGYIIDPKDAFTGGAAETVQITAAVSVGDVADWTRNALVGAVMRPEMPSLAWEAVGPSTIRAEETSASVAPDLDLHAYLTDGTHIGMNYDTGVFENPVEGAIVSGDMVLDAEWIVLPPELRAGARFEVASDDAVAFFDAYPNASDARERNLSYTVEPVALDPVTDGIARGESQAGTLEPGAAATTSLDGESLRLAPLKAGRAGGSPFATANPMLWELAGAAVLLVLGVLFLAVPLRRR